MRVKREVFITLGFCESCELEVAVCPSARTVKVRLLGKEYNPQEQPS